MECCGYGECSPQRSFLTQAEKIEMLKDYQKQLENEAKGVGERIQQMNKNSED